MPRPSVLVTDKPPADSVVPPSGDGANLLTTNQTKKRRRKPLAATRAIIATPAVSTAGAEMSQMVPAGRSDADGKEGSLGSVPVVFPPSTMVQPRIPALVFHMEGTGQSARFEVPASQPVATILEAFCQQTASSFENILIVCNGRYVVKDPTVATRAVQDAIMRTPLAPGLTKASFPSMQPVAADNPPLVLGVCENPSALMLLRRMQYFEQQNAGMWTQLQQAHAKVQQLYTEREQGRSNLDVLHLTRQLQQCRSWLQDARRARADLEARVSECTETRVQLQHKIEEGELELQRSNNRHERLEGRLRERLAVANQQLAQFKSSKRGNGKDGRPRQLELRLQESAQTFQDELEERDADLENCHKQIQKLRGELARARGQGRRWESECHRVRRFQQEQQRAFTEHSQHYMQRIMFLEHHNQQLTQHLRHYKGLQRRAGRQAPHGRLPMLDPGGVCSPHSISTEGGRVVQNSALQMAGVTTLMAPAATVPPAYQHYKLPEKAVVHTNGMNANASEFVPVDLPEPIPWQQQQPRLEPGTSRGRLLGLPGDSIWSPGGAPRGVCNWPVSVSIGAATPQQASEESSTVVTQPGAATSGVQQSGRPEEGGPLANLGQEHLLSSLLREVTDGDGKSLSQ